MTDHGVKPTTTTTDWNLVGGNAAKKQAAQANPGQKSGKSTQNDPKTNQIDQKLTTTPNPRRNDSLFMTHINFKVIPTKDIQTFSVPISINRIVLAIKSVDKKARLVAFDNDNNEIEFTRWQKMPNDEGSNKDIIDHFIDSAKTNKSNQLTGLFVLRSDIDFKTIKKDQAVQKLLNDTPRIFLTPNYLNAVTPTAVGFFIGTVPRPDKPDTFFDRFHDFIKDYNISNTKYQFDYGPIWATGGHRVSVYKLMSAYEDKETFRAIMEHYHTYEESDTYICMTEYGSLPNEQKIKTIRCQIEYATKYRSLFISGFKTIDIPLRENATDQDEAGQDTLGQFIFTTTTGYGHSMFSRVYEAVNGSVELHVPKENLKEATDWARLAVSVIAAELTDAGLQNIFENPQEAMDFMAIAPTWKPHTLASTINQLDEPQATTTQQRRQERITLDYSQSNTKKAAVPDKKKAAKVKTTKNTANHAGQGWPLNTNPNNSDATKYHLQIPTTT